MKFTGQRRAQTWNGEPLQINAQRLIDKNIELGNEPLSGMEHIQAYFDMEYSREEFFIQNFKRYKELYKAYPDALFLLNIRDKSSWLRSRALHANGSYLVRTACRLECSGLDVLNHWSNEYDRHHAEVRAFFADKPGNFLEFNTDKDPIFNLIQFARNGRIILEPRHWHVFNETGSAKKSTSEALVRALFMAPDMLKAEFGAEEDVAKETGGHVDTPQKDRPAASAPVVVDFPAQKLGQRR